MSSAWVLLKRGAKSSRAPWGFTIASDPPVVLQQFTQVNHMLSCKRRKKEDTPHRQCVRLSLVKITLLTLYTAAHFESHVWKGKLQNIHARAHILPASLSCFSEEFLVLPEENSPPLVTSFSFSAAKIDITMSRCRLMEINVTEEQRSVKTSVVWARLLGSSRGRCHGLVYSFGHFLFYFVCHILLPTFVFFPAFYATAIVLFVHLRFCAEVFVLLSLSVRLFLVLLCLLPELHPGLYFIQF